MDHIVIISSSVRRERKSHRVALFFHNYLVENKLATSEIIDLKVYHFPIFEDTIKTLENPDKNVLEFAGKIHAADGIIIVTPEYNGSFPASLKNVVDLLYEEWHGKPISISTVSSGIFGGSQALISLQSILWKIGAWTVTHMFPVSSVEKTFDEKGSPHHELITNKLAASFIKELLECIKANKNAALSA